METCIAQIMKAISMQNPMLEWPALAPNCNFQGPGGTTLPTAPAGKAGYMGQEGTVEFYTRMGFFFAISDVTVDTIGIGKDLMTGFATFRVAGQSNSNQQHFKDMSATMVFEFTDPASGPALIQADRLIMDSAQVDALVAAPPVQAQAQAAVTDARVADIVQELEANLCAAKNPWSKAFEDTIIYGPGGTAVPTGPYLGLLGAAEFMANFEASPLSTGTSLKTLGFGTDMKTLFLGCDITGVTPSTQQPFSSQMTIEIQFKNGTLFKEVAMMRFGLDPTLID